MRTSIWAARPKPIPAMVRTIRTRSNCSSTQYGLVSPSNYRTEPCNWSLMLIEPGQRELVPAQFLRLNALSLVARQRPWIDRFAQGPANSGGFFDHHIAYWTRRAHALE